MNLTYSGQLEMELMSSLLILGTLQLLSLRGDLFKAGQDSTLLLAHLNFGLSLLLALPSISSQITPCS